MMNGQNTSKHTARLAMLTVAFGIAFPTASAQTAIPPTVDSVSPAANTGTAQTLTFQFSSVYGSNHLYVVYALINGGVATSAAACRVEYVPVGNALYLFNDAGTGLIGPVTPGSPGTLSNTQCTVDAAASAAAASGNSLSLQVRITLAPGFSGSHNLYGIAWDTSSNNSGWQLLGYWYNGVPQTTPPEATSVSPSSGAGASQVFTSQYSSVNGYAYLKAVRALINSTTSEDNACEVRYVTGTNQLFLVNDAGTALLGPVTPGGAGMLSNSQCTLAADSSAASGSGNLLTVRAALTFSEAFSRAATIYGYAADNAGLNSGWQALGTWYSGSTVLRLISLSPGSGSGLVQSFTALYADGLGIADLASVGFMIGPGTYSYQSCYATYVPSTNSLYLYNDAGTSRLGPLIPGAASSIANSQCTLSGGGSSVAPSGSTISVTFAISFPAGAVGTPKMYLTAARNNGQSVGLTPFGAWTPNASSPWYPQPRVTTSSVIITPASRVTTPGNISSTNDPTPWVVDIGSCPSHLCFTVAQDPNMGPSISANWNSSATLQQGDIAIGANHAWSTGIWNLSQKTALTYYFKDNNAMFTDVRQGNTSVLSHYALLYDTRGCYRQWYISGASIPVGQWVLVNVENFQAGAYYAQNCPLDYKHIGYFEVGVFGPNLPYSAPLSVQLAAVGSSFVVTTRK